MRACCRGWSRSSLLRGSDSRGGASSAPRCAHEIMGTSSRATIWIFPRRGDCATGKHFKLTRNPEGGAGGGSVGEQSLRDRRGASLRDSRYAGGGIERDPHQILDDCGPCSSMMLSEHEDVDEDGEGVE